jgi:transcriptional regulator GlxA family with amidase domain
MSATDPDDRAISRDELAELVIQASRCFDTDQQKAKCCIQRAAMLVRDRRPVDAEEIRTLAVRGGLAAWQRKKLIAYVELNIGQRISTPQLAALVHVSSGHFCRAFKRSFGMSPHSYVTRQRIRRAEILMTTSARALSHIAIDCGLSDQAHFSRTFRRIVGTTPNSWRQAVALRQDPDPIAVS